MTAATHTTTPAAPERKVTNETQKPDTREGPKLEDEEASLEGERGRRSADVERGGILPPAAVEPRLPVHGRELGGAPGEEEEEGKTPHVAPDSTGP